LCCLVSVALTNINLSDYDMKLFFSTILSLFLVLSSARASIIEIQFNTLTFTDGHQLTGLFNYNTNEQKVESLAISLFGDEYNIAFDLDDLDSPDAFSVNFDNDIFGDNDDEGFQLNSNGIYLLTGLYGYGGQDTCYFDDDDNSHCTGVLFRMTSSSPIFARVDAPQPAFLLLFGLTLLLCRKHRK
jgi:hypothetical protein